MTGMTAPCRPLAIVLGVVILASLVAGWAHAGEHAPKVGDHYQPATDDHSSHRPERAPARKVCEQDSQGRTVRCRELQQ